MVKIVRGVPPRFDHDDFAKLAPANALDGSTEMRIGTQLLPHLKDRLRTAFALQQSGNRLRRDAHRFFAVDVLAGFDSGDGHLDVQVARRGDVDCVDILLGQQLAVVGESFRIVAGRYTGGFVEAVGL